MSRVVTYQLAYPTGSDTTVDLCDACVERGDHEAGALGPVSHGSHRGTCEGRRHPRVESPRRIETVLTQLSRVPDEHERQAIEAIDAGEGELVVREADGRAWVAHRSRTPLHATAGLARVLSSDVARVLGRAP